jgi:hypothetical protein
MARKGDSANFQIIVNGKTRSYRDMQETASEAGIFLNERQPQSEVVVRDARNNAQTVIGWKNGSSFSCDPVSPGTDPGPATMSALGVRRAKAALSSGCKSHPATLQPEATGAAMEVTR